MSAVGIAIAGALAPAYALVSALEIEIEIERALAPAYALVSALEIEIERVLA